MISKSGADNYTFKARFFVFIWAALTGLAWFALDRMLDDNLKQFYIFLQAAAASYSPVQWFGNKALVLVDGQSYRAAELAAILIERPAVQKMVNLFFVIVPAATIAATGFIFFLFKKKKSEAVEAQHQLKKWNGQ